MNSPRVLDLQRLTDDQLMAEVKRLAQCERSATALLVGHLAELDARRLYRGAGFPSLFAYCTEALGFSGSEAYNRIEAARAARRFPIALELLAQGAVGLTTIRLLAPHLTLANHMDLLKRASGKSRLEVEELIAECFPRPAIAASVRKLPATKDVSHILPTTWDVSHASVPPVTSTAPASAPTAPAAVPESSERATAKASEGAPFGAPQGLTRKPAVTPLDVDRYKVSFTASADTLRKLRRAQELLRHQLPEGDVAGVIDRALSALLGKLEGRRFAAVASSRPTLPATPGGRHIPAAVRRAVWLRDGGCCAFVASGGRRCCDRNFIEFHHLQPHAAGGPPTEANIALRCRTHNGYEAEQYFGPMRLLTPRGMRAPPQ